MRSPVSHARPQRCAQPSARTRAAPPSSVPPTAARRGTTRPHRLGCSSSCPLPARPPKRAPRSVKRAPTLRRSCQPPTAARRGDPRPRRADRSSSARFPVHLPPSAPRSGSPERSTDQPRSTATTDGGTTWASEVVPTGVYRFSDISCASTAACHAVGMATLNGPGVIIGTGDGGSTWATEATPTAFDFLGVSCPAVGACTAVGDSATSGGIIIGQAPISAVLLPSNGATASGSQLLDATASSPVGMASVSFEITCGTLSDQIISGSTPTIYGWLGSWNTTTVPNGACALQSVATDVDNRTTSQRADHHHRSQPATDDRGPRPLERGHPVRKPVPRRRHESANVSKVSFELTGEHPERPGHLRVHAHHLRLDRGVEHHDGAQRHLHPPERGLLPERRRVPPARRPPSPFTTRHRRPRSSSPRTGPPSQEASTSTPPRRPTSARSALSSRVAP